MNLSTVSGIRFSNLWQGQVGYNLHSLIFVTKQYNNDSDEEATSYTNGKVRRTSRVGAEWRHCRHPVNAINWLVDAVVDDWSTTKIVEKHTSRENKPIGL